MGSTALLVCFAHTHTHTRNDFLMTDLVQICPRLDTELITVLCKGKHSTNIVFLQAYFYTLGTGWYNNSLALEVETKRSWISGDSQGRRRQTRKIPRRTGQWSLSLGMGPGR